MANDAHGRIRTLSTTVTVRGSSGRSKCCLGRKQDLEDACPDALFTPALIAAGDRRPGAEALRQFAPRGPGAHDPEHALHDLAMIDRGTSRLWLLRGKQGTKLLPPGIGERGQTWQLDGLRERS